jgi:hypothetical protein
MTDKERREKEAIAAAARNPHSHGHAKPRAEANRQNGSNGKYTEPPAILTCADLLKLKGVSEEMLFEGYPLPACGVTLKVGASKSGKTLLAVQEAVAIASGKALFDYYTVLHPGAVMIIEQDDPGGAASIKTILERCGRASDTLPFYLVPRLPFGFGLALLDWLEAQIMTLKLRMVVLDSYTALRGPRCAGIDIVKAEHFELTQLDELAKRLNVAIVVIHHGSKGAAKLDWTQSASGTFAMAAATESQIHVSRFDDLDIAAPERLVRMRGRHAEDAQIVLRFRRDHLDYEHVIEGSAAPLYPVVQQIKAHFGLAVFTPKEFYQALGLSRATAFRMLERLWQASLLQKRGRGEYVFCG